MRSILYKPQPGFGRFVAISLALHLSFFAATVTIRADEKKSFYTPVYTVDLIAPPKAKEKPPVKIKKATTPVKKRPVKKRVEKKKPVKVPVEKVVKKPIKKTPEKVKEKITAKKVKAVPETSDAIKKIREAVRKKDAATAANVRIAALEKKAERGKAEVAALKKKLAEEAEIKKALKEIRTLSAERRTVKKEPEKASIEKAPTAPTSPAPSLVPQAALRADHKPYYDRVAEMIQKNWSYLEVPKDGYELLVSLKIDKKGKLMDTWIEKGTPNRLFNDSLINAVKKAAPFPPLPATMEAEVFELGLRFCPRGCG